MTKPSRLDLPGDIRAMLHELVVRTHDEPITVEALAAWLPGAREIAVRELESLFDPARALAARETLVELVSEHCPQHLDLFFGHGRHEGSFELYAHYCDRLVDRSLQEKSSWIAYPWSREGMPEAVRRDERAAAVRFLREAKDWASQSDIDYVGRVLVEDLPTVDASMRRAYAEALVAASSRAKSVHDVDLRYNRISYELLEPDDIEAFLRALASRPKLVGSAVADVALLGGAAGARALARITEDDSFPRTPELTAWQRKVAEQRAMPRQFEVRSFEKVVESFATLELDSAKKRPPKLKRGRTFSDTFDFASYSAKADKEEDWLAPTGRVIMFPCLYLGEADQGPWTADDTTGLGELLDKVASFEAIVMKGRGTVANVTWLSQPGDFILANLDVFPPDDGSQATEVVAVSAWRVSEGWAYVVMKHDENTGWRLRRLMNFDYPTGNQRVEGGLVLGHW